MNERKTPLNEFFAHPGTYIVAVLVLLAAGALIGLLPGPLKYVGTFVSVVIQFAMTWFYFNAVHRGYPDSSDLIGFFTIPGMLMKSLPVVLVEFIISSVVNLISNGLTEISAILGLVGTLCIALVTVVLVPVKYLFCANSGYDTAMYFKMSVRYMQGNRMKYWGIVLKYALVIVAAVVILSLMGIIGILAVVPVTLVVLVLSEIEVTQFMTDIIPAEWYDGFVSY